MRTSFPIPEVYYTHASTGTKWNPGENSSRSSSVPSVGMFLVVNVSWKKKVNSLQSRVFAIA